MTAKNGYAWLWLAVDRDGRRWIDCEVGSRDSETGAKLWRRIEARIKGRACTDYRRAYEGSTSAAKHIRPKKETYTVEGYNSLMRHYLARLRRKSKCSSKSGHVLLLSVKLLIAQRNGKLSIFG